MVTAAIIVACAAAWLAISAVVLGCIARLNKLDVDSLDGEFVACAVLWPAALISGAVWGSWCVMRRVAIRVSRIGTKPKLPKATAKERDS